MSIQEEFDDYVHKCYREKISTIQYTELRRAFYAGVHLGLLRAFNFADQDLYSKEISEFLSKIGKDNF